MSLIEKIKAEQLEARKSRDSVRASLLTTLLGEVGLVAKNAGHANATDEEVVAMVKKFIKNNESIPESARHAVHDAELAILNSYLPQQLTADQIQQFFAFMQPANKGAAMKLLKEHHAGQYDGKLAAQVFDSLPKS